MQGNYRYHERSSEESVRKKGKRENASMKFGQPKKNGYKTWGMKQRGRGFEQ